MTAGVPAPAGWEARAPHIPGCVAEWRLDTEEHTWLQVRIFGPRPAGKGAVAARVEVSTGPAGSIPAVLTDPAALRRAGWALLNAMHAAAGVLEHGTPDGEPVDDPQLSIYDALDTEASTCT